MANTMIEKSNKNSGRVVIGVLLFLFAMGVFGWQIFKNIELKQHVTGQLKLAADANNIELAEQKLTLVLDYLEANDLTSGYTSALYETPTEDIGFWYQNLKASKQELGKVEGSSQLEKTNTLIKLRETLLDGGKDGKTKVTYPKGLARYPNNLGFGILTWMAVFALFGSVYYVVPKEEWAKMEAEGKQADAE